MPAPDIVIPEAGQLLEVLVKRSMEIHERYRMGFHHMGTPQQLLREFFTIRLMLPRRSGNSTAAAHVTRKLFERTLLVTPETVVDDRVLTGIYRHVERAVRVAEIERATYGRTYDCVLIDDARWLSPEQLHYVENYIIDREFLHYPRFQLLVVG